MTIAAMDFQSSACMPSRMAAATSSTSRAGLASRWRFITPDWPGQGRSGAAAHPARLARYTTLLAGFMDALKIDRAVLIGNSIGGSAAMAYAAQSPDRVAGLVLADPGGLIPMNAFGYKICGMIAALGRAGQRDAFYFKPIFSMMYRQLLRTPAAREQRERIQTRRQNAAQSGSRRGSAFALLRRTRRESARRSTARFCSTWATRDPLVSFSRSKDAIGRFPNHSVALFGGGHCPFLEEPEKFLAAVEPFIEKVAAGIKSGRPLAAAAR